MAPSLKVLYRNEEVKQVKQLLNQGCSVVVYGEAGIGKDSLVQEAIRQICASVVSVDIMSLVARCRSRGKLFQCIDGLVDRAAEMRALLHVPHIELLKIIEDGGCKSLFSEPDAGEHPKLLQALCARVGRGDVQCVATTTAYDTMLGRVSTFFARFRSVKLTELSSDKTAAMLCANQAKLSSYFGQYLGMREIICAVRLTDKYFLRQQQPAKAMDLLEEVCSSGQCSVGTVVRHVADITSQDASCLHKEFNILAPTPTPPRKLSATMPVSVVALAA